MYCIACTNKLYFFHRHSSKTGYNTVSVINWYMLIKFPITKFLCRRFLNKLIFKLCQFSFVFQDLICLAGCDFYVSFLFLVFIIYLLLKAIISKALSDTKCEYLSQRELMKPWFTILQKTNSLYQIQSPQMVVHVSASLKAQYLEPDQMYHPPNLLHRSNLEVKGEEMKSLCTYGSLQEAEQQNFLSLRSRVCQVIKRDGIVSLWTCLVKFCSGRGPKSLQNQLI